MRVSDEEVRASRARFPALVAEIAALLPGEFRAEPQGEQGQWFHLVRPDGLALSVSLKDYDGRIFIRPAVPQGPDGGMRSLRDWGAVGWDDPTPEASVSADRPAKGIAGDIARKVLAPYAAVFSKIGERRAEEGAQFATALSLCSSLSRILGDPGAMGEAERRLKGKASVDIRIRLNDDRIYGHFRVSAYGSVEVELRNVKANHAEALARAIMAVRSGDAA